MRKHRHGVRAKSSVKELTDAEIRARWGRRLTARNLSSFVNPDALATVQWAIRQVPSASRTALMRALLRHRIGGKTASQIMRQSKRRSRPKRTSRRRL